MPGSQVNGMMITTADDDKDDYASETNWLHETHLVFANQNSYPMYYSSWVNVLKKIKSKFWVKHIISSLDYCVTPVKNWYPEGASSNPARVNIFQLTSAV